MRNYHVFACNFAKYSPISIFFTLRPSNKPFLIWLLTTPLHIRYAATSPCNLSSLVCFADINVSQSSAATYARCNGICSIHLTANLPNRKHAWNKHLLHNPNRQQLLWMYVCAFFIIYSLCAVVYITVLAVSSACSQPTDKILLFKTVMLTSDARKLQLHAPL